MYIGQLFLYLRRRQKSGKHSSVTWILFLMLFTGIYTNEIPNQNYRKILEIRIVSQQACLFY